MEVQYKIFELNFEETIAEQKWYFAKPIKFELSIVFENEADAVKAIEEYGYKYREYVVQKYYTKREE